MSERGELWTGRALMAMAIGALGAALLWAGSAGALIGNPETTITGGPSGASGSSTASFSFNSPNDPFARFECALIGPGQGSTYSSCSSPKSYSGLADGAYTFWVRAVDAFGVRDSSPASRSFTVDTVVPETTITAGPSGTIATTTAAFSFAASESGATFECKLDTGSWSTCTSPKSYSSLSEGPHTFSVRATDAAGNTDSSPASRSFTVSSSAPDTTPPDTTITSGPSGTIASNSATFSFTASEPGVTFKCRFDTGAWSVCASPKAYSSLKDGDYTFSVRATDAAGNTDSSPASRSFTVSSGASDTTPPDTTITSGPSGTISTDAASFTFTASESGARFECKLDTGHWSGCTSPNGYTALAQGEHTFSVRATDTAGNVDASPASRAFTVAVAAPPGPGAIRFIRRANSAFDPVLTGSSDAEREWMRAHYWRMRGYPPFFDQALSWAPPTHFYKNLYAIYRDRDQQLMADHPDWVLKDSSGNKLFIPFDCNGTTCTQYAADIGNPQWRSHWIGLASAQLSKGYAGVFIDDVNMFMKTSDGAGNLVRPIDPRTGQPMPDADWRRYMAEFVEQIDNAFPGKEISQNPIWWAEHSDPYVQRQIDAGDMIELERGFNDAGIVGGTGTFGFETYLAHVDWLHARGKSVIYEPYGLSSTSREFEIASYYLVRALDDAIASDYESNPDNWWTGWETDLGSPSAARYTWNGLFRRDFSGGMVLVNQPGASTKTVTLPNGSTWTDLSGNPVTSVTLGARRGKVLRKG